MNLYRSLYRQKNLTKPANLHIYSGVMNVYKDENFLLILKRFFA